VFFYCLLWVEDHFLVTNPLQNKYTLDLTRVYPQFDQKTINSILSETWNRVLFVYEPFTQFKEKAHQGNYVNISKDGFRYSVPQKPWPPPPNQQTLFLFGGSTAFGYGLPDKQTIASYVQNELPENSNTGVYNFGRGYYYSAQELVLFQNLLLQGYRPSVAIFLDGLNDLYFASDKPIFSDELTKYFSGDYATIQNIVIKGLQSMPLSQFIKRLLKLRDNSSATTDAQNIQLSADEIVKRYKGVQHMITNIAEAYGIKVMFVIQPVPFYHTDTAQYFFDTESFANTKLVTKGYELLNQAYVKGSLSPGTVWAADLGAKMESPGYIDSVHYSSYLSGTIATFLAGKLVAGKYLQ
jgi:hypothetical protein